MWQTKYVSAVLKNLGVGVDFWRFSEGDFLSQRPQSMVHTKINFKIFDQPSETITEIGIALKHQSTIFFHCIL